MYMAKGHVQLYNVAYMYTEFWNYMYALTLHTFSINKLLYLIFGGTLYIGIAHSKDRLIHPPDSLRSDIISLDNGTGCVHVGYVSLLQRLWFWASYRHGDPRQDFLMRTRLYNQSVAFDIGVCWRSWWEALCCDLQCPPPLCRWRYRDDHWPPPIRSIKKHRST